MQHISSAVLMRAVAAQERQFSTHDVIRFLYTKYQKPYLAELLAHDGPKVMYPFTATHREIGRSLLLIPGIRKTRRKRSTKTMRGKSTMIQEWERI